MPRRLALLALVAAALALLVLHAPAPSRDTVALGGFGRGPEVVLVHGLGSGAEDWLPVARNLARDHRVAFVELPGHGVAEMPGELTLAGAAEGLDRAIAAESAQPVVLVGHSVGGLVAMAEALRSPQRVRALVLVETALRPQLSPRDRADLLGALERDYRGTLRASFESFGRDSAQGARLFAGVARLDSAAMKRWIRFAVSADLSGRAADLRMPLLVVLSDRSWPEGEGWLTCADSLGYRGAVHVTHVRVRGAGHFVMLDEPALVAECIRRFERNAVGDVALARR